MASKTKRPRTTIKPKKRTRMNRSKAIRPRSLFEAAMELEPEDLKRNPGAVLVR